MTYRIRLWALLAATLALSLIIALSSVRSGRLVDEATRVMVDERMLGLDLVSQLDAFVVEHERAYYRYYATAFEVGAKLDVSAQRDAIAQLIGHLHNILPDEPRVKTLDSLFARIYMYGDGLRESLKGPDRDWDLARENLKMVSDLDRAEIAPLLASLETDLRSAVVESGEFTLSQAQSATQQVLIFAGLVILVGALIAIYVERFVKESAERRRLAEFPARNPDPVLTVDLKGRVTYANAASLNFLERLDPNAEPAALLPAGFGAELKQMAGQGDAVKLLTYERNGHALETNVHFIRELELAHVHIKDVTERNRAQDRLRYLAEFDDLTGLGNRRGLSRYASNLTPGQRYVLAIIEPAGFQRITASIGFEVGDALINDIATKLRTRLDASDFSCRLFYLEGAQFCVVASLDTPTLVDDLLKMIGTVFDLRFDALGASFHLAQRVGFRIFEHQQADTETLLRNATAALRVAIDGNGAAQIEFDERMEDDFKAALELETELRSAIELGELRLVYQPQCAVVDQRLIGFESLLRWRSGALGDVSPARFIPLAETSGLIVSIGLWVLEQACEQAMRWQQSGAEHFRIAVNVSPRQLAEPGFIESVEDVLSRTGVNPSLIQLEITESAIMDNIDSAIAILEELAALGLDIALDDFGTGQASLSYLKSLPVNKLKIDQSFLRGVPEDSAGIAILRSIMELGRQLNLALIAEGVESQAQLALLQELKCDFLQGYWYARPLSVEDAESFLFKDTVRPDPVS